MNQAQRNVLMGHILELEDRLNEIDFDTAPRKRKLVAADELQREIAELKEGL